MSAEKTKKSRKTTKKSTFDAPSASVLAKLVENKSVGMLVFDVEGNLLYANQRLGEILGYSPEEIDRVGIWHDLIPAEWSEKDEKEWRELAAKDGFQEEEVSVKKRTGKTVTLLVSGTVVETQADGNYAVGLTIIDVTELKRSEEKFQKSSERLTQRVNSLEAKLKSKTGELQDAKKEVTRSAKSLDRLNSAMKSLIVEFQEQRKDLEDRIVNKFHLTVEPIVEHFKGLELPEAQRHLLDTLDFGIKNITSYFGINVARKDINLSPREIQICQMIRQGKDSREISHTMGLSYQTVIVHRKNIRKKLGLKRSKQNLATYLQQNM